MCNFPHLSQFGCGLAALKIISKYYGKNLSIQALKEECNQSREGVSLSMHLYYCTKMLLPIPLWILASLEIN
jgi:ABC-type bacteriocin/lantibiotic exporter with double-glycine peptidase domain